MKPLPTYPKKVFFNKEMILDIKCMAIAYLFNFIGLFWLHLSLTGQL